MRLFKLLRVAVFLHKPFYAIIKENYILNAKSLLLSKFTDGTFAAMTDSEICDALEIRGKEKSEIRKMLHSLCEEGKLCRDYYFHYGTPEQLGAIKGKISGNERGFGFLIPDDKSIGHDFFIPARYMHGAFHSDAVYVVPVEGGKSDDEAEVIKIIERGMTEVVGTFFKDKTGYYLRPDEKKYASDIFISQKKTMGCKIGDKAVARITEYPTDKCPGGEIIEILHAENGFFLEELSIIRSYNLREEFPEEVMLSASEQAAKPITEEIILGRKDFRDKLIFTIDGEDTRDIDDAVSVERNGEYFILGVHIADVSEYVRLDGALDKEALKRGTSVYFPDRVLPMLPKALSNGICSLNEGVDRLTLSCIMKIDGNGKVVDAEITKSVIKSAHRMTYAQVTAICEGDEKVCAKYPDLIGAVKDAEELTKILMEMRRKKGSVELDVKESHIILTPDGKIEIPDFKRTISQDMIEQFMVLANETVAEYMTNISVPFVYRIHEKPSEEKARQFKDFLLSLGVHTRLNPDEVRPYDYKIILDSLKDIPFYNVVNRVMLRSMMKAKYSPINVGHFGLSSSCYCHFTSPIRRYPDLCIHRIIKEVLDGRYEYALKKYPPIVSEAAEKSSAAEKKAQEAERDVDDLYSVMYMTDHIGEEYEAVISGVTSFGLFAELKNAIEGFIPIETLPEGIYEFIDGKYTLRSSDLSFRLGEKIKIKVAACNFDSMRTEFSFIAKSEEDKIIC